MIVVEMDVDKTETAVMSPGHLQHYRSFDYIDYNGMCVSMFTCVYMNTHEHFFFHS